MEEFDKIKIIERGAFGEAIIVKKKDISEVFDMIKKNQVQHIRAERDLLPLADNHWVIKLFYSFQDEISCI